MLNIFYVVTSLVVFYAIYAVMKSFKNPCHPLVVEVVPVTIEIPPSTENCRYDVRKDEPKEFNFSEVIYSEWHTHCLPVYVGEYNASFFRDEKLLRWWDGDSWSYEYFNDSTEDIKELRRGYKIASNIGVMEWRGMQFVPKYHDSILIKEFEEKSK